MKNTYEAKEKLSNHSIPDNYELVSFDVQKLFTSIPHDLALNCLSIAIDEHEEKLFDTTRLQKSELIQLVKLCLSATTFKFNGVLYKQISGLPMGSPISVVLSEIVMQHIEKLALNSGIERPLFWFRYVDDCIAALPSGSCQSYSNHLNSINSNIQFTYECQINNQLSFLDMKITVDETGVMSYNVFRKPSNSGKYLDFNSYHHTTQKRNVVLALKNRAHKICSENTVNREYEVINNDLKKNGYPSKFISNTQTNRNLPITSQNTPTIKYISGPYVKGASEKIGKLLLKYGTKLASKSSNTLRRNLCKLKDKREAYENSGIVYEIKCLDCSATYIGETGRELKLRIKEHQENSRKKLPTSPIYKHLEETGHRDFDWDNATIKGHSNRKHSRLFLETCFTLANENSINRHIDIPKVYRAAINNIIH